MSSEKLLIRSKLEAIRRKDHKEHANSCLELLNLYKEKGLLEKAFREASEYKDICQNNLSDRADLARAVRQMGEIKVTLKDRKEGLSLIKRYHEMAKALGDVLEVQRALTTLGRTYLFFAEDENDDVQRNRFLEKAEEFNELAFDAIPKANSDKCTNMER